MKKLILTSAVAFATLFVSNISIAQVVETTPVAAPVQVSKAQIKFNKETHDYGTIKNGADGSCVFEFTNTGTEPLMITNAKGSCGCTVPEWPKEPIAPGAKASIKVNYDTKRTGAINKSVTITSNASNEPTKIVYIKGEVMAPETNEAPVVAPEKGNN
jgi:hypothetical protein